MASPAVKRPKTTYRFLISACLAGYNCTYKGKNKLKASIKKLVDSGAAIPVCPEVMGGLPVPRENSEIVGGGGVDVLRKKARVISISGKDLTSHYLLGADLILRLAAQHKIKEAILKSKSPACGSGRSYDGSFRRRLTAGDGVLTALLRKHRIKVRTE